MIVLHVESPVAVSQLASLLNCNAQFDGVKMVWITDTWGPASWADVAAEYDATGLAIRACTELGELYLELVLAPLIAKEAS